MHRWGSWMSGQTLMCPGILSFSNGFDIQIIHDIQRYENRYWHNLLFREAEMPIPFIVPVKIICGFCLHERGEKIRFNTFPQSRQSDFHIFPDRKSGTGLSFQKDGCRRNGLNTGFSGPFLVLPN